MAAETIERKEGGFELDGEGVFYPWRFSDNAKDLMLVDMIAEMPAPEFAAAIEDGFDRSRTPILLTVVATSIRAGNPDWSVQRIYRKVMNLNLSQIVFIDADAEEQQVPPAEAPGGASTGAPSASESSSSPTPQGS